MNGNYSHPLYLHDIVEFNAHLNTCAKCGIIGPVDTAPNTRCPVK
jgi:hypothetical protein